MIKKILITGSNGFIGRYITKYLSDNGYFIYSYDLKHTKISTNNVESVDKSFFEYKHDIYAIIHLAYSSYPSDDIMNITDDIDNNVKNTINLLDFSVKNNVNKFVFMSSGGAVYGNSDILPISEFHETNPISSYGITKLMIEKYLRLYHNFYNIKTCSIRLSNPYNEFFDPCRKQGIIPLFCNAINNGDEIQVFGNGNNLRDFIHMSDVQCAIQKIIEYDFQLNEINIGCGVGTTVNKIIEYIEKLTCKKAKVKYVNTRCCDVINNVLDIRKAKTLLNWNPTIDIYDGIKLILNRK